MDSFKEGTEEDNGQRKKKKKGKMGWGNGHHQRGVRRKNNDNGDKMLTRPNARSSCNLELKKKGKKGTKERRITKGKKGRTRR